MSECKECERLRARVAELEVQLEQSRSLGKLGGYPCTPEHTWTEWLEDRTKRVAELEAELRENEGVIAVWRRRTQEAEAAQAWRPISSAPKTGRTPPFCNFHEILGRDSAGRVEVIAWGDASEQWLDGDGMTFYPDAWLPLPAPPKVAT